MGGKFPGAHPHGGQRHLEFAACLGDLGGLVGAAERGLDFRLRRRERSAIGEESKNWNHRDDDNARPDRDP